MAQMKRTLSWHDHEVHNNNDDHNPLMPVVVVKDSGRLSSCISKAIELYDQSSGEYSTDVEEWNNEKEEKLDEYIATKFHTFYYSSTDHTVTYDDNERKEVFEFVKACAEIKKIRELVIRMLLGLMLFDSSTLQGVLEKRIFFSSSTYVLIIFTNSYNNIFIKIFCKGFFGYYIHSMNCLN